MGEEDRKKRTPVESLGWLTESTIMPKKQRAIEGVGASSILELKAHLYHSQEESRKTKELNASDVEYQRAKKITHRDAFSNKNSGVEARAHKDKLELKAVTDGTASYSALEKKAQLYEKLVRGELSDEEEKEKYCVDFFRKSTDQDESQLPRAQHASPSEPVNVNGDEDTSFPFNTKPLGAGRRDGVADRDEHKRFIKEVHAEVNQAREKVSELKFRRQEQAVARREKLRQAYLRKQLEKLKAASNTNTQDT